ncbi:MAG: hypothetical protein Q9159_007543 [Coniocarpon cinnabarinum]
MEVEQPPTPADDAEERIKVQERQLAKYWTEKIEEVKSDLYDEGARLAQLQEEKHQLDKDHSKLKEQQRDRAIKILGLQTDINKVNSECDVLKGEARNLKLELQQNETRHARVLQNAQSDHQVTLHEQTTELHDTINDLNGTIDERDASIKLLQGINDELNTKIDDLQASQISPEAQRELNAQNDRAEDELRKLQQSHEQEVQEYKNSLQTRDNEHRASDADRDRRETDLQNEILQEQGRANDLDQQLAAAQSQNEALTQQLGKATDDLAPSQREVNSLREQLGKAQKDLAERQTQVNDLDAHLAKAKDVLAEEQKQGSDLHEQLGKAQEDLATSHQRAEELQTKVQSLSARPEQDRAAGQDEQLAKVQEELAASRQRESDLQKLANSLSAMPEQGRSQALTTEMINIREENRMTQQKAEKMQQQNDFLSRKLEEDRARSSEQIDELEKSVETLSTEAENKLSAHASQLEERLEKAKADVEAREAEVEKRDKRIQALSSENSKAKTEHRQALDAAKERAAADTDSLKQKLDDLTKQHSEQSTQSEKASAELQKEVGDLNEDYSGLQEAYDRLKQEHDKTLKRNSSLEATNKRLEENRPVTRPFSQPPIEYVSPATVAKMEERHEEALTEAGDAKRELTERVTELSEQLQTAEKALTVARSTEADRPRRKVSTIGTQTVEPTSGSPSNLPPGLFVEPQERQEDHDRSVPPTIVLNESPPFWQSQPGLVWIMMALFALVMLLTSFTELVPTMFGTSSGYLGRATSNSASSRYGFDREFVLFDMGLLLWRITGGQLGLGGGMG